MMEITKTCPICGTENTHFIDVEPEAIELWNSGMLIQEAMGHLNADEREFIKTGICFDNGCWPEDTEEL